MKAIPIRKIASSPGVQTNVGRFDIRSLQQVLDGKDLVHELHRHDFFFILILYKGKGIHEIDFTSYDVHDNSIFILRPGQVHKLELTAESEGFLMEFDLSFYQPKNTIADLRWKKATNKNFCGVESSRFRKLYSILNSAHNEYATKQEGYTEAIKAYLDLFFIEYVRQSHFPTSVEKTEKAYIQERFEELTQLLETNIRNMKNASQYADLLNLSSYQLNAITKSSVGKTISDLINEQIILEAKRNLLATSNQIKDIAWDLGYEDVSYFIRFFKKHTGLSPDAFRKNFR